MFKKYPLLISLLCCIALFIAIQQIYTTKQAQDTDQKHYSIGLHPTQCWFERGYDWPTTECFYMATPEDSSAPQQGNVLYPVVVFRSAIPQKTKSPLLHLGAGGPGAAMNFASSDTVEKLWRYHDDISLHKGRDFYVIDPRGSGLSKPLLSCDHFVDNVSDRLEKNLTLKEEWALADNDYFRCIKEFQKKGVRFSHYNSHTVAEDVEQLRQALNIERWVLLGVSHAASYAQIIAKRYPDTVEAMILDSATFPNQFQHDRFLKRTLAPYQAFYNYCGISKTCEDSPADVEKILWSLYQSLNQQPLPVLLNTLSSKQHINVQLNGVRLIATLLEASYDEKIYADLNQIIKELQSGSAATLKPYIKNYVEFMLDRSFGDLSFNAHYCYEEKAFTNYAYMKKQAELIDNPILRELTKQSLHWQDYCSALGVLPADETVVSAIETDIPTLFLHGELDTVTPLSDVQIQQVNFKHHIIASYPLAHDILSSEQCAESVAAAFVARHTVTKKELQCHFD